MSDVLFLVPARAGSKRLPDKNVREVGGIPLLARAIGTARAAAARVPGRHRVICSTDSEELAAVARRWGAEVPFMRPADLATDQATSAQVALHALATVGGSFDLVALVQPTSPHLAAGDLAEAIAACVSTGRAIVGVSPSHPAGWHVADGPTGPATIDDGGLDASRVINGAIYVIPTGLLRTTGSLRPRGAWQGYEMPKDRSIDVDDAHDLAVARGLLSATPVGSIDVGGRMIGDGQPCFVIAEAGVNHDGDLGIAHALVAAAADAGADAVKFQTFDPDRLAALGAPLAAYQESAVLDGADQRAMLRALVLDEAAHAELQAHARERGILFLSSPFDEGSADLLERLDVPAFKVGSGELTNLPFLAHLAAKGKPMLVSTGMSDLAEVAEALDAIRSAGAPPVALLHCVSAYPMSPGDANLAAVETMRLAFGVPVGWSDHSEGIELALAAAARGSVLLEKHLTLDRMRPGPDHRASLEPDEFRAMVEGIRTIGVAIGDGRKRPTDQERAMATIARKSLHWRTDLAAGTTVEAAHLLALRPGDGVPPGAGSSIEGLVLACDVSGGSRVEPQHLVGWAGWRT